LSEALAQAAWAEADLALAQAVAAFDELAAPRRKDAEASAVLGQALAQAARRRGFERFGSIGAVENFDPHRHELAKAAARVPVLVQILVRGVVRGQTILVRARVAPAQDKDRA
jgi:hypothetical protein